MSTKLRAMSVVLLCFLALLLAACQPQPDIKVEMPNSPTPDTKPAKTEPVPPTETSCPEKGKARSAVLARYALGLRQSVIYIFNEFDDAAPIRGTLRYFSVSDNVKKDIISLANTNITSAQISTDGQWILFASRVLGGSQLQLVRADGKGLQTLYCGNKSIFNIQWSRDQKHIGFFNGETISDADYSLLDTTTGTIHTLLKHPEIGKEGLEPSMWLDNQYLYASSFLPYSDAGLSNIYLIDITKGDNQTIDNTKKVADISGGFFQISNNSDATRIFIARNGKQPFSEPGAPLARPSTIVSIPALGGAEEPIYSNAKLAVSDVSSLDATRLLFIVDNDGGDSTQNGVWRIDTDGKNAVHIGSTVGGTHPTFNAYMHGAHANVSRDYNYFAIKVNNASGTEVLQFGPVAGGELTTFADFGSANHINLVGWTLL